MQNYSKTLQSHRYLRSSNVLACIYMYLITRHASYNQQNYHLQFLIICSLAKFVEGGNNTIFFFFLIR